MSNAKTKLTRTELHQMAKEYDELDKQAKKLAKMAKALKETLIDELGEGEHNFKKGDVIIMFKSQMNIDTKSLEKEIGKEKYESFRTKKIIKKYVDVK